MFIALATLLTAATAGVGMGEAIPCVAEPTSQTVEYGNVITCRIDSPGDTDSFRFHGEPDELIVLQVAHGSDNALDRVIMSLYDPDGQFLAQSNSAFLSRLRKTGDYSVVIEETDRDNAVDYTFTIDRLEPRSLATPFICFGCSFEDELNPHGDIDLYAFNGSVGDFVSLRIGDDSDNALRKAYIQLIPPSGAAIPASRTGIDILLDEDGLYTILVRNPELHLINPFQPLAYNLSLQCIQGPCTEIPPSCALLPGPAADLEVLISGAVKFGSLLTTGLAVFNFGSGQARDVILSCTVPEGLPLELRDPCRDMGGAVECALGDLPAQGSRRVPFSVRLPEALRGVVRFACHVSGATCDPDESNNSTASEFDLGSPPEPQIESLFPHMVDGTSSGVQFRTQISLINTGSLTQVQIDFLGSPDGEPMNVDLGDRPPGSSFQVVLKEGGITTLRTSGSGPLRAGYVRIRSGAGVSGILVLSQIDSATGVVISEAGVPPARPLRDFSIFVDSLGDRDTGLALVYPTGENANNQLTLRLYDTDFNLIDLATASLPPGGHIARFANQFFTNPATVARAREMQGVLTVESSGLVSAVTLRQVSAPGKSFPEHVSTLTVFPVVPGRVPP